MVPSLSESSGCHGGLLGTYGGDETVEGLVEGFFSCDCKLVVVFKITYKLLVFLDCLCTSP